MEERIVNSLVRFGTALKKHDAFLIIAHENPDPDSIGSMLAMFQCLKLLGKKAWMISDDPIPNYSWPNIEKIVQSSNLDYKNVIVLDCEPDRTGSLKPLIERADVTFNLDHHEGNKGQCSYNYIDTKQAATCMIIYHLINHLQLQLSYELAQPLYGGIVGDTGGFRHANTSQEVFIAAADLVAHGACPSLTAREIFNSKTFNFVRFTGYALSKIEKSSDSKIVWLALSYSDFVNNVIDPQLCDQLIDYVRMVADTEIVILFREIKPNIVRIGFRSNQVNIRDLAVKYSGGGHVLAAGAQIEGELTQIVDNVVNSAGALLAGDNHRRHNKCN